MKILDLLIEKQTNHYLTFKEIDDDSYNSCLLICGYWRNTVSNNGIIVNDLVLLMVKYYWQAIYHDFNQFEFYTLD